MKSIALIFLITCSLYAGAQSTFYGRTTGQFPYLEYGRGDDRLGGAKMTYLDSNILVKVVDSTKDDYKVQLSANHCAYLPKINFKKDTLSKRDPYFLTSSWRVSGDDQYDFVTIGLPERLPYKSIQLVEPSSLVIDIFGVVNNTNWITQLKTAKEIKNVWYEHVEDDVFRMHIDLKHTHWGYGIFYKNNTLNVRIKRQPELKVKGLNIAIDAGHGGSNTGASGLVSKVAEKEYTLKIAKELESYLRKKGANVFMIRTTDVDVNMIERTLLLRQNDPDILISIHLNSSSNTAAKGVSTYYRYLGFRPLSQKILDRMLDLDLNNFGNIGAFNFALSGPTEYPNCLVEVAFLSNAEDEQKILDEDFRRDVARQIFKGIRDWLKSL
jgi:N-acetylmuramoyl-L-alanine amidase